jgi:hypothetical protein
MLQKPTASNLAQPKLKNEHYHNTNRNKRKLHHKITEDIKDKTEQRLNKE